MTIFKPSDLLFQDTKAGKTIGKESSKNGLYVLEVLNLVLVSGFANNSVWPAKLVHLHIQALKFLLPNVFFLE